VSKGRIVRVAGPVVDVEFPPEAMPEISHALEFDVLVEGRPERVVAEVAPSGPGGLDPARLEAFARARLASHQVPKRWVVVPAVARSELGKPLPPAPAQGPPG